jgi:hypothetical protein
MDYKIQRNLLPVLAARFVNLPYIMVKFKDGESGLLDLHTRRLIDHPDVTYTSDEVARIMATGVA